MYNDGKLKVFGEVVDRNLFSWALQWQPSTFAALGLPLVTNFMVTFPQLVY